MGLISCSIFLILLASTRVWSEMNITDNQEEDFFKFVKDITSETNKITNYTVTKDQVTFQMYRNTDTSTEVELTSENLYLLDNTTGSIVFMTHGWTDSGKAQWLHDLKDAFLNSYPDSVPIIVDWHIPASQLYYVSALSVEDIANIIGDIIVKLVDNHNINIGNFLVIGHSLGGQITGFTGKRVASYGKTLPRVFALDPAGPLFEDMPTAKRLNPTDAKVVEVLHTDGNTFGFKDSCGTIDFFANGGDTQPGCSNIDLGQLKESVTCSHIRAYKYLIEAIYNRHSFKAVECSQWSIFSKRCHYSNTEYLGNLETTKTGNYYFNTDREWPFSKEIKNSKSVFDKVKGFINKLF